MLHYQRLMTPTIQLNLSSKTPLCSRAINRERTCPTGRNVAWKKKKLTFQVAPVASRVDPTQGPSMCKAPSLGAHRTCGSSGDLDHATKSTGRVGPLPSLVASIGKSDSCNSGPCAAVVAYGHKRPTHPLREPKRVSADSGGRNHLNHSCPGSMVRQRYIQPSVAFKCRHCCNSRCIAPALNQR